MDCQTVAFSTIISKHLICFIKKMFLSYTILLSRKLKNRVDTIILFCRYFFFISMWDLIVWGYFLYQFFTPIFFCVVLLQFCFLHEFFDEITQN